MNPAVGKDQPAASGRPTVARPQPAGAAAAAPLPARFAALLLDLACGAAGAALCCLAAFLWLLWRTDGGVNPPADAAIYIGIAVALLWLPVWGVLTVLAWSGSGETAGLAAMRLRVVDAGGRPPSPIAALLRFVVLALCAIPLLLAPLLVVAAVAAAVQHTLPPLVGIAALLPVVVALIDPVWCVRSPERRALHDVAAGTRVVRRA